MISRPLVLLAILALGASSAPAQESADSTGALGRVVVHSNLDTGVIYADDVLLGTLEETAFELAPGHYALTLAEDDLETWQPRQASADIEVRAGETNTVQLDVPYRYRIESFPYGATVTLGENEEAVVLGETPLVYESADPLEGELVVAKLGHLTARQPVGSDVDNHYSFVLKPLNAESEGGAEVGWSERKEPNTWIDVAAVGIALTAGAAAAYYKFKGDDLYDEYLETGDPALRPRFERYDNYSGVALGVMQVGFGVFAVRLVLR